MVPVMVRPAFFLWFMCFPMGENTPVLIVLGPLAGLLSDRLSSRFGRRRPMMLLASLVAAAGFGRFFSRKIGVRNMEVPPWKHTTFTVNNRLIVFFCDDLKLDLLKVQVKKKRNSTYCFLIHGDR